MKKKERRGGRGNEQKYKWNKKSKYKLMNKWMKKLKNEFINDKMTKNVKSTETKMNKWKNERKNLRRIKERARMIAGKGKTLKNERKGIQIKPGNKNLKINNE